MYTFYEELKIMDKNEERYMIEDLKEENAALKEENAVLEKENAALREKRAKLKLEFQNLSQV